MGAGSQAVTAGGVQGPPRLVLASGALLGVAGLREPRKPAAPLHRVVTPESHGLSACPLACPSCPAPWVCRLAVSTAGNQHVACPELLYFPGHAVGRLQDPVPVQAEELQAGLKSKAAGELPLRERTPGRWETGAQLLVPEPDSWVQAAHTKPRREQGRRAFRGLSPGSPWPTSASGSDAQLHQQEKAAA